LCGGAWDYSGVGGSFEQTTPLISADIESRVVGGGLRLAEGDTRQDYRGEVDMSRLHSGGEAWERNYGDLTSAVKDTRFYVIKGQGAAGHRWDMVEPSQTVLDNPARYAAQLQRCPDRQGRQNE